jgi:biopolymer transport protein ExbB
MSHASGLLHRRLRPLALVLAGCACWAAAAPFLAAQQSSEESPTSASAETREPVDAAPDGAIPEIDVRELFRAGGAIGIVILALSVAMLALVIEHLLTIRRSALMPRGLAEECHDMIMRRQFKEAYDRCVARPSFLGHQLAAGVREVDLGYSAVEKAMEDAATEQSARLFRKIEYLSVIGTLAPMLGLLGTVWGMILAFMEFEAKANPQVSDLAPAIYKALVTTLFGLGVAVPAVGAFAYFRNRIDELVAETSLVAEHVFFDFKRTLAAQRRAQKKRGAPARAATPQPGPAP